MTDIPSGSRVIARNALSGNVMSELHLTRKHCLWSAQRSVRYGIAAKINVPWQCVKLVGWGQLEDETIMDGTDAVYQALFLWVPVDQYYMADSAEDGHCFICRAPCADADDTNNRHMNCVRCCPCFLCKECRVFLPTELFDDFVLEQVSLYNTVEHNLQGAALWPVCLWCLQDSDLPAVVAAGLPDQMWQRIGLLSDVFLWKGPVQGFTSWWNNFVSPS